MSGLKLESDKVQSTNNAQEEYAVEGLGLGGLRLSDKDPAAKKSHQKATDEHTFQKSAN